MIKITSLLIVLTFSIQFASANEIPNCWSEENPKYIDGTFLAKLGKTSRDNLDTVLSDYRGKFAIKPRNVLTDLGLFLVNSFSYHGETREETKSRVRSNFAKLLVMYPDVSLNCYIDE